MTNNRDGALKGAQTKLKRNPNFFNDMGRKGGAVSGNRPMRDIPGYASELAKKRWANKKGKK